MTVDRTVHPSPAQPMADPDSSDCGGVVVDSEPRLRQRLLISSMLVALTLLVFAQVRNCGFINFDDGAYVTENPHVLAGLRRENLLWAFGRESTELTGNWHPLTWLSLMLDAQILGTQARDFHLVNLALHTANVLLLFELLFAMTRACWRSAFVAAVFAVHPLHVESVAWISERKDVLSTAFGLLAIRWYVSRLRTGSAVWHVLSLVAFACSLAAKPMLVTLPFLLLLLDDWPLQRVGPRGLPDESRGQPLSAPANWRSLVFEKTGYFLLAILFSVIACLSQRHGGAVGSLDDYPLVNRCLNALIAWGLYLFKTIWPAELGVFYPYPRHSQPFAAAASAAVLLSLSLAAWRVRQTRPWLIVGWLWFLGTLTPVIGIVQIGGQRMADRYMYVPIIGLLIAAAWGVAELARGVVWRRRIGACSVMAIVVLAIVAAVQTAHWRDSMSLFTHTLSVAESSLAHTKVGYEYATRGQFAQAQTHFRAALRIDPDYAPAHRSRGNAFLAHGRLPEAEASLRKAIQLDPGDAEAHYNLGIVRSIQGDYADAIEHYERSLSISPAAPEAHVNLATALAMQKDDDAAIRHLRQAIELAPEMTQAHFNLANMLAERGERSEAIEHYQQVLAVDPELVDVHIRLATLDLQQGDRRSAIRHLQAVLRRQPESPEARELLRRANAE